MDNTPAFHPLDYISVLRRRVWWLVTPILLAIVVGAALLAWLPRQYQSTATIGVSLPTMSSAIVSQGQRVTLEERIRAINQLLSSAPVLERVAHDEGLDRKMKAADAVQLLRSRMKVTMPPPSPSVPVGMVEEFFLNYTDSTPATSQRITNRIADVFVEESSRTREVRAEETSAFIGMQVNASKQRLDDLEARLRTAKEAFMGALPEQTQANVAMVTGLQQQLESTVTATRGEQDRLALIERQLSAIEAGASAVDTTTGNPGVTSPASVRVLALERELAQARNTYTDKHPEVIRLKDELAAARAEAAADASKPQDERLATLRVDPNFNSLRKERDDVKLRIAQLQRQQEQIQSQIGMYRSRVESAPRVEQQIATLEREYDLEKQQYADLASKLHTAEMAESLERNQGGEHFTVLAHAPLPAAPSSPNTQRLMLVTALLGICLGAGAALAREYLDRSVYDARALSDLDLPVLGEIPRIAQA
jgi:polysaccharide chain length determinant protein (PEP-CTERM system associated)